MEANAHRPQRNNTPSITTRIVLLFSAFAILGAPHNVMAAGCTDLGGALTASECVLASSVMKSGVFDIEKPLHIMGTGAITVPPTSGGNTLTLNVQGDFTMESGSLISGDVAGNSQVDGVGATITVNAIGDIVLKSGSDISANQGNVSGGSCSGGKAGNVFLNADLNMADPAMPGGFITVESGAEIRVDARCPAGEIVLDAARDAFVDGFLSSESGNTGTGAVQRPGGGPITVKAGCNTTISDNAVVSSRGRDPGADLVQIVGGCAVEIFGLVESTLGHAPPNTPPNRCALSNRPHAQIPLDINGDQLEPTACLEIWSGGLLTIDRQAHNGEVNTDTAQRGGSKIAWIDIFARKDIAISGPVSEVTVDCDTASNFAVHANELCVTDSDGGVIAVKSTEGKVTATGRAIQATAPLSGSHGGYITIEANQDVTLDSASLEAKGDAVLSGGLGKGGVINVRAFNTTLSWKNGVGDVLPTGVSVVESNQTKRGIISLQDCAPGAIDTTGTNFPKTNPADPPPPPTIQADACGGAPVLPGYVTLPSCGCIPGISIDKACVALVNSDDPTGTTVRVNFSGKVTNTGSVNLTDIQITDTTQPGISGLVFDQLPPSPLLKQQSADYSGHYFVTPQAGALNFTDMVTATGKYKNATVTSQPATASCALTVDPKIKVTKACKNPSTTFPNPVEFIGMVCNDGLEQLTKVTITDSPEAQTPPGISLTSTVLNPVDPGKCADYSGSYVPTQAGLQQKDTVTAVGQGKLSGKTTMTTASAFCDVLGPAIDVTKSCSAALSDNGTMITVTVSGIIKNTGGVKLNNVTIKDDPAATFTPLAKTSLTPNEEVAYTGSYKVASIPAGGLKDTVTAEGDGESGSGHVSDTASAECSITPSPAVTIDQTCVTPNVALGQPITFQGQVCNTGNEQLKNLTLSDEKGATLTPPAPIAPLAPNACLTYTAMFTPGSSGAQSDKVTIAALGTISGTTVTAFTNPVAQCTVNQVVPALTVKKDCVCSLNAGGTSATVQFNGEVCNTGQEALMSVTLVDNKPSANTPVSFPTTLAKGACQSFNGSYQTTDGAATDIVTVNAVGVTSQQAVSGQDDASCGCNPTPGITVTTVCSPSLGQLGSSISFSGKVCSTGNVALGNLTVVSNKPAPNSSVSISKNTLAAATSGQTPGDAQCVTYSGKYKPNGSGAFSHTITAAGLSIVGGVTQQVSASATCALGQSCFPADWLGLATAGGWVGYNPKQKVSSLFSASNTSNYSSISKLSLQQALGAPKITGTLQKAAMNLVREAIAALLNAAHPQVSYAVENTTDIVSQVNAALASGNVTTIKNLTNTFSSYNKLGGAPVVCQATPPPC